MYNYYFKKILEVDKRYKVAVDGINIKIITGGGGEMLLPLAIYVSFTPTSRTPSEALSQICMKEKVQAALAKIAFRK
jgi:hypothetical protein